MSSPLPKLPEYAARRMMNQAIQTTVACKICSSESKLYDVVDFSVSREKHAKPHHLAGIPVYFYKCSDCDFVFTDFCDDFSPEQWTNYIYNADYYLHIDPDYSERRPQGNANPLASLLSGPRDQWLGLDYGGGHGRTAQLLRERGYAYQCHDPFGDREVNETNIGRFNFCSAFEVAEHSPDPMKTLGEIISLCSPERLAILFATHVHDGHLPTDGRLDGWYAAPRNGHISLYSRESLARMACAYRLNICSVSSTSHLFFRGYTNREAQRFLLFGKLRNRLRRAFPTRLARLYQK